MMLRYLTPLFLAAAALPIAACSGDDDAANPSGNQTGEQGETVDIEMTIEDFSFDPAVIEIDLGDEISLELANDGELSHTFSASEFFVDETLESGQDADVSFTPNEPGEFTFFCRIHPDTMQGSIRVARAGETPAEPESDDGGGAGSGY